MLYLAFPFKYHTRLRFLFNVVTPRIPVTTLPPYMTMMAQKKRNASRHRVAFPITNYVVHQAAETALHL